MSTRLERLMKRTNVVDGPDGCWQWTGSMLPHGYGRIGGGLAHRQMYEELVGVIPAGLTIDHLCRNRGCVNPAHLEAVTLRENLLRGDTFQARNAAKTHCPHGHPYAGDNLVVRNGRRFCRECALRRQRRSKRSTSPVVAA